MARRITVVVSQGQSSNPTKRGLEESLVAALLFEKGVDVTVVPHLYDLAPDGTGMLCLKGVTGDLVLLTWMFPRAARWVLARNGVLGQEGRSLLKYEDQDDEDQEAADDAGEPPPMENAPSRRIYCLDLKASARPEPFVEEIRRILTENTVQLLSLGSLLQGKPKPSQLNRFLNPGLPADAPAQGFAASLEQAAAREAEAKAVGSNGSAENGSAENGSAVNGADSNGSGNGSEAAEEGPKQPVRIEESTGRRWYPVIDLSRCTNCLECLDFCLFGVYSVDKTDHIWVDQPDNCKKGCPACSRVCPENAIIFPQHKTPSIAGSLEAAAAGGGLKIDLSQLFGAPSALEMAAMERDTELVADGREAVGLAVGIPKRQSSKPSAPKDDLDALVDELDALDL